MHSTATLKVTAMALCCMSLSGCLGAAVAVPVAAGAGTTMAGNVHTDKAQSYTAKTRGMSCNQLRAEWARVDKDTLGKANPLGNWSVKRTAVRSTADNKGCRLST